MEKIEELRKKFEGKMAEAYETGILRYADLALLWPLKK